MSDIVAELKNGCRCGGICLRCRAAAEIEELQGVRTAARELLEDVIRRYPEIEHRGFTCAFMQRLAQALRALGDWVGPDLGATLPGPSPDPGRIKGVNYNPKPHGLVKPPPPPPPPRKRKPSDE